MEDSSQLLTYLVTKPFVGPTFGSGNYEVMGNAEQIVEYIRIKYSSYFGVLF